MTKTNSAQRRPTAGGKQKPTGRPKAPAAPFQTPVTPKGKIDTLIDLLRGPAGATVEAMMDATGWQKHSVRGAISGAIKKDRGLVVISEKTETGRVGEGVGGGACRRSGQVQGLDDTQRKGDGRRGDGPRRPAAHS